VSDIPNNSEILKEQRVCEKHGDYVSRGSRVFAKWGDGKVWWDHCPKCLDEAHREREEDEKRRRAQAADRALEERGISGRLREMTFESYRADTQEQDRALTKCREFSGKPDGTLVLIGGVGTGKTHLAVAIARETRGTYSTLMRMIRNIRESYRHDSPKSEQQLIDWWAECEMLVLDEVGVQHCTEAEQLLAYEILNERYVQELPTVLISNETIAGMGKILGERVMDRLAETGQVVAFTWSSYRRRK
jgi:DNA replication protein DnaC